MRTCNYGPCEQEEWIDELTTGLIAAGVKIKDLGKTCDVLGKKNHALGIENEQLRGKLEESRRALADANRRAMEAYRELLALRTQLEGVPPSTDRPDLRAKFLGAFDNVVKGPCTAHDAFSTACLEDGDQYLL